MSAQTEMTLTSRELAIEKAKAEGRAIVIQAAIGFLTMTPAAHGRAGADDAHKHLVDHAPGWVLEALGDALLAYRLPDLDFTSEDVRLRAERNTTVKAWLAVKGRENCFPGWWQRRVKLHRLERTKESRVARRPEARGRVLPAWRFPRPTQDGA